MHNRFSTPDILGSVMTGTVPELNKSSRTVYKEEGKEKATFNLSRSILSELEDVCHEIRKRLGSKQVSKTLLVEEALKTAFSDFTTKKEESSFFQSLQDLLDAGK